MSGKLADRSEPSPDPALVDMVEVVVSCAIDEFRRRGDTLSERETDDVTEICTRKLMDHLDQTPAVKQTPRLISELDFDTMLTALRAAGGLAAEESEQIGRRPAGSTT